ncbi:MAG: tRNA lysidine(34) synthetase TilS, partial [Thermoanaerobaculia bacterium]
ELEDFLNTPGEGGAAPPSPLQDPTNRDLGIARNRVRRGLLPRIGELLPDAPRRLARLAQAARTARDGMESLLEAHLSPAPAPPGAGPWEAPGGLSVPREALEGLPRPVLPHALALLHRRAGAPYPAGRAAVEELARQLADPGALRAGVDCPGGWRWESAGDRLVLGRTEPPPAAFSYTLTVPGEVEIPEIGIVFRVCAEPAAPWMLQGARRRAGLALPLEPGDRVEIRSRRPGDRLRPLGAPGTRKLKDVLMDARVPRRDRDSLPLLLVDGRIAWVPGVTVDQRFRLEAGHRRAWQAEMIGRGGAAPAR